MNLCPPLIGITLENDGFKFARTHDCQGFSLSRNCTTALIEAGGIPIGLPLSNVKNNTCVLDKLDGIILYRQSLHPAFLQPSETPLTAKNFPVPEFALLQAAWDRNIPTLAIDAGLYYLNLFLEGTIHIQYMDALSTPLPHEQENPPHQGSHIIHIQPDSMLFPLANHKTWLVNSFHTQAIQSTGKGIISAFAEDGMIEAVEDPSRDFFLGVQWHPEFSVDYTDRKVFSAFIRKAKSYAQNRH